MRLLPILAATLLPAPAALAQCPTFQSGFEPSGASWEVRDLALFDDGSGPALYAAGGFGAVANAPAIGVARWDGASWSALPGITLSTNPNFRYVDRIVPIDLGSGPLLCAMGDFFGANGLTFPGLALWNGTQWSVPGGGPPKPSSSTPRLRAAAVLDTGSGPVLYVGGNYWSSQGQLPYLASWDGNAWTFYQDLFGSIPCDLWGYPCDDGSLEGLAVHDFGAGPVLHVGGSFASVAGQPADGFATFDGASWSAQSAGAVDSVAVHDDGGGAQVYLAGTFPGNQVLRWDGASLTGLGSPVTPVSGSARLHVLAPGPGMPGGLWILPPRTWRSQAGLRLSRWDGAGWQHVIVPTQTIHTTRAVAVFDSGAGPELFLGGRFLQVQPGSDAQNLARWNGVTWMNVGGGGNGFVHQAEGQKSYVACFGVQDYGGGPALHVGGKLLHSAGSPIGNLAIFDGVGWSSNFGTSSSVESMLPHVDGNGPHLRLAGSIGVGGGSQGGIWNGTSFSGYPFFGGTGRATVIYDHGAGPGVYFLSSTLYHLHGGNPSYTSLGVFSNNILFAATKHDDGSGEKIYVGGTFNTVNGLPTGRIARWDGSNWEAVGNGLGTSPTQRVMTMLSVNGPGGPQLYVGGKFQNSGGVPLSNLARWDGTVWHDVGGGVSGGPDVTVRALTFFDDGRGDGEVLYVGGSFRQAGGQSVSNLARFDGVSWDGAGLEATGSIEPLVRALSVVDLPVVGGRTLLVGGDFDALGGVASQRVGMLPACTQTTSLYCIGDGSVFPCPCGNESTPGTDAGCKHSQGLGGRLRASGTASLSADTLVLEGSWMPDQPVLYFQGLNQHAPMPFGDGIKCTGGQMVRLGTRINVGGASTYPGSGGPGISLTGMIAGPGVRHYQARYRDGAHTACTPEPFNYTNGVRVVWGL